MTEIDAQVRYATARVGYARSRIAILALTMGLGAFSACGGGGDTPPNETGGRAGEAGDVGGHAGSKAGQGGGGRGGTAGGGRGGTAGHPLAGDGGVGGEAGENVTGGGGNAGDSGRGGAAGNTGGGGQGGSAGVSGGGSGGNGGTPCIKVTPDGDDALAAQSGGVTPFRNVQPAIDFADSHRSVATSLCVAAGADCSARASFPGPTAADFRMRNGISVYGSYETASWTRCAATTVSLVPDTPMGIHFGPEIQSSTVLDRFTVVRVPAETTTAVSVQGARNVRLSSLVLTGPTAPINARGVDLWDGADATLSAISIPNDASSTGVAFGVRVTDSRVVLENSDIRLEPAGSGSAYALWLDDADGSRVIDTVLRAVGGVSVDTDPASFVNALHIQGGNGIEVEGGTLRAANEGGLEQVAIDVTEATNVTLTETSITAYGHATMTETHGVRVARAQVTLDEVAVDARGDIAVGVGLVDSAGSNVGGTFAVVGSVQATGVSVQGSAATVDATVTVSSSTAAVGVAFGACGGEEPTLRASVNGSVNASVSTDSTLEGIRILGDCHPSILNAAVAVTGVNTDTVTGIRCGTADGVASRCAVTESTISTELSLVGPGGTPVVTGVRCDEGCSEISDSTITGPTQAGSNCFRSCGPTAYGIELVASNATIARNVVSAGCADRAAAIHAIGSSSRVENNLLAGLRCAHDIEAGYTDSAGVSVSGGSLDVHSNTIDAGGSEYQGTTSCVSAAVFGGGGSRFRNNIFGAGRCGLSFGQSFGYCEGPMCRPSYVGPPMSLENNAFDPNATGLYAISSFDVPLTSIGDVNALPGASGNIAVEPGLDATGHLQAGSLCIDAGTTNGVPADDIDGDPRGPGLPDVGSDEWDG